MVSVRNNKVWKCRQATKLTEAARKKGSGLQLEGREDKRRK
jgi:hypothetical protein